MSEFVAEPVVLGALCGAVFGAVVWLIWWALWLDDTDEMCDALEQDEGGQ